MISRPRTCRRAQHVTVINETLARLNFPGEDPIGKRVYFGGFGPGGPPEWHEVIGVVGDVRHRRLDADPDARAYDLFGQHWGRTVSLAIRTTDGTTLAAGRVRRLLSDRDPRLAVFAIRTMADLVSDAVATRRLLLWLVGLFAAVGLVVALVGLYGDALLHRGAEHARARRASRARRDDLDVYRMVVGRGLKMVAGGLVIGVIGVAALGRAIESQLVGMTADQRAGARARRRCAARCRHRRVPAPAARAVGINPVDALKAD